MYAYVTSMNNELNQCSMLINYVHISWLLNNQKSTQTHSVHALYKQYTGVFGEV